MKFGDRMYVKKRHLEMIRYLNQGGNQLQETFPEEYKAREIELYIMGLVENGKLTEQGKLLWEITKSLDLEQIPDIFMDTSIATMLEEYNKSNILLDTWEEPLKIRFLIDEEGVTDIGKKALVFAQTYQPNLYISPEMIGLLHGVPPVGKETKLREYAKEAFGSDNIINAMEAIKLLTISPPDEKNRKTYSFTRAYEYLKHILPKQLEKPIILSKEEIESLYGNRGDEGQFYQQGEITNKGMEMLTFYEHLIQPEKHVAPSYLSEIELDVLKTIRRIEEIHKNTPDITPTYKEIRERGGFEKLMNILYLLEVKKLIENRNDAWWITQLGYKALEYGSFTIESSRALTMPKNNQAPAFDWLIKANEENLITDGYITGKGIFALKLSETKDTFYLTKYDAMLLSALPRGRYLEWDNIQNKIPSYEKEFIGEAEAKNLVEVLHNHTIGLTPLGEQIKLAIEKAKLDDIKSTEFPITPTFYKILEYFYNNHEKLVNLWKERGYSRMVVQIIKDTKLYVDEVKKALVVLRNLGFIGKLGLTESGKRIVEAMKYLQ